MPFIINQHDDPPDYQRQSIFEHLKGGNVSGALQAMMNPPGIVPSIAGVKMPIGQASKMAVNVQKMDPGRFRTVTEKGVGYEDQNFPVSLNVRVWMPTLKFDQATGKTFAAIEPFDDAVKGLNYGHALRRAADNWEGAERIAITGIDKLAGYGR